MKDLTRRDFLKISGATLGTLLASKALAMDILTPVTDPLGAYPYRGWEPFYKDLWNFDYFGRVAHSVNCTGSCTWGACTPPPERSCFCTWGVTASGPWSTWAT